MAWAAELGPEFTTPRYRNRAPFLLGQSTQADSLPPQSAVEVAFLVSRPGTAFPLQRSCAGQALLLVWLFQSRSELLDMCFCTFPSEQNITYADPRLSKPVKQFKCQTQTQTAA